MKLAKKITLSALAATLAVTSLGAGPFEGNGAAVRTGWLPTAHAEEAHPPVVEPPVVEPPVVEPPVVEPPVVEPPVVEPPVVEPPVVEPPVVEPPVVEPPVVEPPVVEPPVVEPPVVEPPFIQPPYDMEAEWANLLSSGIAERVNELYAALAAGDPADFRDVQNLRVELDALDEAAYGALLDPIWSKISARLPESVDREAAKTDMLRWVKALASARYDPTLSEFRAIRWNPEFIAFIRMMEAAGGGVNVTIMDAVEFLWGDGGQRKGIEGALIDTLSGMTPMELVQVVASQEKMTSVLLQATAQVLNDTENYKASLLLSNLNITVEDIGAVLRGFQLRLQKDEPAVRALLIAYIRMVAEANAQISEDGREHRYSLSVFGVEVPSMLLRWEKASGDPEANVSPDGVVTIPEGVESASAVIRASLVNPLNGVTKVIFERQITLTAVETEGDRFPVESFMARMNLIRDALLAGDPADARAVRNARDEIAGLNAASNQRLIDPIWTRIAPRLPADADPAAVRIQLFEAIRASGTLRYDPQASGLEAVLADPDYRAAMEAIGEAAGVNRLSMHDYFIFWYGDGEDRGGVEGEIRDIVARMRPTELGRLLGSPDRREAVRNQAVAAILSRTEAYPLSAALSSLGIRSAHIDSVIGNFQSRLRYDEQAGIAWTTAYIRAEAVPTVEISANGRQHQYRLTFLGVEIPTSVLKWSKVSGSRDVNVSASGKVTIPNKVAKATAVIQAVWTVNNVRNGKVLFQQEVTLVNGAGTVENIVKELNEKLDDVGKRLDGSTGDEEKVQLLLEVVQLGKETANRIQETEASKRDKDKAINETKQLTLRMTTRIIQSLLDF
ncbi:hypothetical protein ACF3MZ_00735 [Paenibacillaceae bacterium WGS1546]|uniref:hypothetical protein n=1 Tax=Cohnella sp. WGS1546 TaxID=3366810 RepID=UPI00372D3E3C